MKTLAAVLSSLCLVVASPALADEAEAPVLVSIAIAPDPVDISAEAGQITVTLQITDDGVGFSNGQVNIYNPDGDFVRSSFFTGSERTSGDNLDGIYSVTVDVPAYAPPGTWRADLSLRDSLAQERNYGPNAEEFPVPADRFFEVANTGTVDAAEPDLTTFSTTPEEVPAVAAEATVTLILEITDATAGFSHGFPYIYGPDGTFYPDYLFYFDSFTRTSGDEFSGTYEVQITLPEGSAPGVWHVDFYLVDQAGNSGFRSGGTFTVISGGTTGFSLGNALDAVQLPWSSPEPSWTYQTVESNDGVDAAMSGPTPDDGESVLETTVTGPGTLRFTWKVDSEELLDDLTAEVIGTSEFRRISGDTGWLSDYLEIPPGEHTVVWKYVKSPFDAVGQDRGWVDQVHFEAATDLDLPVLQSVDISPDPIDITHDAQTVTFTAEVTDDFLGCDSVTFTVFDPLGAEFATVPTSLIGGEGLRGFFEGSIEIPFESIPGQWRVEVTLVEAFSMLPRYYGPANDPFPNAGEQFFTVSDGTLIDTEPPLAAAVQVSPDPVDVSAGLAYTTVTLRVTDTGSGFDFGSMAVYTPSGEYTGATYFSAFDRVSGTDHDGIYVIQVPVPAYANPGQWSVGVYLADIEGNDREYPYDPPYTIPGNEYFTVINSGTVDTVQPLVTAIEVAPFIVDVSEADVPLTITVSLEENLSGIRDAILFFYAPGDEFDGSFTRSLDASNRISGDELVGTYQVTVPIPQGTRPGGWLVRVFLRDRVGLTRFYGFESTPYPGPGSGNFEVVSDGGTSVYDTFTALHELTGDDALRSADPDHDGFNNATELLFGTDPSDPASGGWGHIVVHHDATHLHMDFTIDPSLAVGVQGDFLALGGGTSPFLVTGQKQTSTGLTGPWTNVLPNFIGGSTYRISIPTGSYNNGFLRLFFEEPGLPQ